MRALILKELRGLCAYVWLILGTSVVFIAYTLATSFPDQRPLTASRVADASDGGLTTLIFGLIIGAGLLIREEEDRTLSFLDGLPVSRTRIFFAKVTAGFLVLLLIPASELLFDAITGLLSRTSIDSSLPWRLLGTCGALHSAVALYSISIAIVLSFLRQWMILTTGLIVWTFAWLTAEGYIWHQWLSPMALFSDVDEPGFHMPWLHVAILIATTVAGLLVAWFFFCRIGIPAQDFRDSLHTRFWGRVMLGAARFSAPIVWFLAVSTAVQNTDKDNDSDGRPLGEVAFAKHETARYEFLFRESQRDLVKELFSSADDVFNKVAVYLPTERKERIVVDLASPVPSHAAAVTNWTKIRFPIPGYMKLEELERVMAHETAHVLAHRAGGSNFVSAHNSTRFFNEGLAQYLENLLYADETKIKALSRLVAALASRGEVPFTTLCDDKALAESRDAGIAYPFGEVFCRALVKIGGTDAPIRVLQEFQRRDSAYSLNGADLWRSVIQNSGLNLEAVTAAYEAEIAHSVQSEADFVAGIPRLSARVEANADEIRIYPEYIGKAPGALVCTLERTVVFGNIRNWYQTDTDGTIRIPRKDVRGNTIRYLLGWEIDGLPMLPVFEPWAKATL